MKTKITFLGTGQAIPTAKRNHTSILLSYDNENILFDAGEGAQRQMRKARTNPSKITRIFITHWHGDHVLGIPGILQTLKLSKYNKTLYIYGPKGTKKFMKLIMSMFVKVGKIKIQIKEITTPGIILETSKFKITTEKMFHGTPTLAYSFIEKQKLRLDKNKLKKLKLPARSPLLKKLAQGKNIKIKGKTIKASSLTYKQASKKITIILDTKENKNAYKLAKNSDLLICESTYSNAEKDLASKYKHLTSAQAANIAKKSKSKKLILIHLSQRFEKNDEKVLQQAKKVFKNTTIAKDLDKIEI